MVNYIERPQMGFTEAVKTVLNRLTDFKGRSRRSEFWWFLLAYCIAVWVISFVLGLFLPLVASAVIGVLLQFLAFGVTVRRLHDTGKSGWWVVAGWIAGAMTSVYSAQMQASGLLDSGDPEALIAAATSPMLWVPMLVSAVTTIVVFVFCLLDSNPGSNKYGESPKYAAAEDAADKEAQE